MKFQGFFPENQENVKKNVICCCIIGTLRVKLCKIYRVTDGESEKKCGNCTNYGYQSVTLLIFKHI